MSAEKIMARVQRRMWRLWLPALAVLAIALYFVLPLPTGLGALTQLVYGIVSVAAVTDWLTANWKSSSAAPAGS